MRKIKPTVYLLLLIVVIACKSENSQSYVSSDQIEIPTQVEVDSIAAVQQEEIDAIGKGIPEPIWDQVGEIRDEKKEKSVFRDEGCCKNEPPPALCCCEPVWIAYLELVKSEQPEKLAKIRADDPILNDCIKKIPSFSKKVVELEMSGEDE